MTSASLPVHSLGYNTAPVQVRRIEHKNPYDFTREHRHTYFEIFFFENGGGSQLIDFIDLPVKGKSCYIVFPQQIHLLKREPEAVGRLLQFGEEVLFSMQLRMLLQQHFFSNIPAIIFESDAARFQKCEVLVDLIGDAGVQQTATSHEIALHYLQALLLGLLDGKPAEENSMLATDRKMLFEFRQLLEQQFHENHQVTRYAAALNTHEKKLALVTKKFLGLSPLQVIHNRLLLEAKRLLLFESSSQKEIAFQLGFDSPANFSLFIKNKTGFSPSELSQQLVNFHK